MFVLLCVCWAGWEVCVCVAWKEGQISRKEMVTVVSGGYVGGAMGVYGVEWLCMLGCVCVFAWVW